jgi:hypothetical protein
MCLQGVELEGSCLSMERGGCVDYLCWVGLVVTVVGKAPAIKVIEGVAALATTIGHQYEEVTTCRSAFTGSSRLCLMLGAPIEHV